jgi:hypothetical protein
MRETSYIAIILFGSLLTGCAAGTSGTRARTTTVPAGPVSTASSSTNLIPAQTTVVIRTNESIEATSAAQNQRYSAEVAQDIVNADGQLIVPKESPATLTVLDAGSGGAVGTSQLELALSSIVVGERTYQVQTDVVAETGRAGLGANERTAQHVGGGAALGALIGAIAGGGSGAVAGAAAGAVAGGTAQVLTRGEAVRVPAETVLTFRLDMPIHLR